MNNSSKILVPFDFSEASVHALEYTINFVGPNREMDVVALYVSVMPISEAEEQDLKKNFSKIVSTFKKKTKKAPRFMSMTGEVIETILLAQKETGADLIMMGTMGDKVTDEAITNTSGLVLKANCPVISIPYGCGVREPKDIALVLGSEEIDDKEVLKTLLQLARTFDSRVHVLTIYKESVYAEASDNDHTDNLLEYYLEHFYVEHSFSKNQDVEEGILNYIEMKKIDLLAIMPRNHTQMSTPSEGRLTKLLTLHSDIPVLSLD